MIDVPQICAPSDSWVRKHGGDTPEQAQLRACLIGALDGLTEIEQITVGAALIDLMRDELMPRAADVRKAAAREARNSMSPATISQESGQTLQTVYRLLAKERQQQNAS